MIWRTKYDERELTEDYLDSFKFSIEINLKVNPRQRNEMFSVTQKEEA